MERAICLNLKSRFTADRVELAVITKKAALISVVLSAQRMRLKSTALVMNLYLNRKVPKMNLSQRLSAEIAMDLCEVVMVIVGLELKLAYLERRIYRLKQFQQNYVLVARIEKHATVIRARCEDMAACYRELMG